MARSSKILLTLTVALWFIGIRSTQCYAQVDSSAVENSEEMTVQDSSRTDSIDVQASMDSTRVDSLNQPEMDTDSLNNVKVYYPFYKRLKNNIGQQPIPKPEDWSITDTSDLGAQYLNSIEKRFSEVAQAVDSTDSSHLFMVMKRQDSVYTEAFIEGYPFYRSYVNYLQAINELDKKELVELKDSIDYNFRRKINIQLTLRSYNTRAVAMDTTLWEIYLKAGDIELSPQKMIRLPIQTKVWGKLAWYERKILLEFPRYVGANDLMFDPRLTLRLDMRKQSGDRSVYKAYYAFRFTEIIEGGAQYQQQ
ncbi:MAG: hypothetical protein ACQETE_06055 [Bacteroidota bacterium]